ncbi:MAG: anti-sigma F factor [Clostridia bacterium]|nr:anti-sigma F factor [Clostridia bacterium]
MSATAEKRKAKKAVDTFKLRFSAKSVNESFARMAVSAFVARLDPTVSELADIKTAVSEAVTNCIVHGYKDARGDAEILLKGSIYADGRVVIEIKDKGLGIEDVETAMLPMYTTDPAGERSGMGFTVMGAFCDGLKVRSAVGKGTTVVLTKKIGFGRL